MWSPDYGYLGGWTIPGTSVEIGSVFLLGIGSIILGLPIMFLIARRQRAEAVLPRRVAAPRHAGSRA